MKPRLTLLAALIAAPLAVGLPAALSSAAAPPSHLLPRVDAELPFTATVVEALESDGTSYVQVQDEDGRRWLAAPRTDLKPGMVVRHSDGTMKRNVQALDRTFAGVFYIAAIRAE